MHMIAMRHPPVTNIHAHSCNEFCQQTPTSQEDSCNEFIFVSSLSPDRHRMAFINTGNNLKKSMGINHPILDKWNCLIYKALDFLREIIPSGGKIGIHQTKHHLYLKL